MARLKSITIIFVLAAALLIVAAAARQASGLLQEGLYAEEVDGNLDAAIAIYGRIINDGSAGRSDVAQAMYRQGMCYLKKQQEQQAKVVFAKLVADYSDQTNIVSKVKPLLDELGNADPAALMPPDTLIYVELGSPGRQVETILKMLKGTPFENPLAAIGRNGGASQGGVSPGDIVAGFLNPSMMAEFKKIRGLGVGITGVAQNNPPFIVVLFPGKSDALRGLIMAALVMLGKPVEAVQGMQCVAFPDGGGAAYDDTVVILASPTAYSAGQLQRSVKQYKGLTHEPTLASSNKSFARVSKKDRQENAVTVWADVDQVFAGLARLFPDGQIPQGILAADAFGDFKNMDDVIAYLSIREDGIALEANVGFKDGHNCLAYNMIRTPKLRKDGFKAVPPEAIALLSFGLSGADSVQAQMLRQKIKDATGLEIGGDIFANVEQVTLFALPVDSASKETLPGVPPIAASLGLSLTSPNPQQTRQILTGLLTAANLTAPQSGTEPAAAGGRYRIELVTGQSLHCYADQANRTTVLSLNPAVVNASTSALGGKSGAGPLTEAVSKLPPATTKLVLINVGGAIRAGAAHQLLGVEDPEGKARDLIAQLAKSCDKTTIALRTHEELNNFNARAEISQLPPVNEVYLPMMQLSGIVSGAREKARAERIEAGIPANIREAAQPPAIDGVQEELWSGASVYKIGNVIYSPASSEADFSASYRAMWDAKNLYVLVNVTDDVLKNDSEEFYLDDAVEVFIDADNSKSADYGDNDYQYFFEWAQANPRMGESRHSRTEGVEFAVGRADVGYRVEIKFPWATLGVTPSVGTKIGLDVHVNDDDDGGERDTKLTWRGKEDNAWQTPSVFGTAELAGLIARWTFDESTGSIAADTSGNANEGTLQGNPTWQPSAGKVKGALLFDGEGDFVKVANESRFDFAGQVTVAAWIKVNRFDKDWQVIVAKGDSAWRLQRNQNKDSLEFACSGLKVPGDSPYGGLYGQKSVNDGQWHHVAGVYDGEKMYLYIDGTVDVSQTASGAIDTNNEPVYIGENSERTGRCWNGLIDDVRVYNYGLSADRIKALYSEAR
jgi:hypothetical protein